MRQFNGWIGLCAVLGLWGCTTGLVSSWKSSYAAPFPLRGEKVAALVMASDPTIRRAGEDALARELSVRGADGIPMYTLLADVDADEAKARAAAEQAGVVGVVVMRPVVVDVGKEFFLWPDYRGPTYGVFWKGYYGYGWRAPWSLPDRDSRSDTNIFVETLVYSLTRNELVWGGQSKTGDPDSVERLIETTARRVADELARQGLITSQIHRNDSATLRSPLPETGESHLRAARGW